MSNATSALRWKERKESGKAAAVAPLLAVWLFHEWMPVWPTFTITPAVVPSGNPSLAFYLLIGLAFTIGYQQTTRERAADMWAFAIHRPASMRQIFGAKVLFGLSAFLARPIIVGTVSMLAFSKFRDIPFDERSCFAAVADCFAVFGAFAAGLNFGAPGGRLGRGFAGAGLALLVNSSIAYSQNENPLYGIAIAVPVYAFIVLMGYLSFSSPSDLESEAPPRLATERAS